MYMNPTIQLHTCYELIEYLLELDKSRPLNLIKDTNSKKLIDNQG